MLQGSSTRKGAGGVKRSKARAVPKLAMPARYKQLCHLASIHSVGGVGFGACGVC